MQQHIDNQLTDFKERRRPRKAAGRFVQTFDFEVRFLRTSGLLNTIAGQRFEAYSQHHNVGNLDSIFVNHDFEKKDVQRDSIIFYAQHKESGLILGSLRVSTNANRPFEAELDLDLPADFAGRHIASFGRLAVPKSCYALNVKLTLFKCAFLYCHAIQATHFLLTLMPKRDRLYSNIGFVPVFNRENTVRLAEAKIDINLMGAKSAEIPDHLKKSSPQFYEFLYERYHPDIKVFDSISPEWTRPRSG
jgi:hypothetical protein